MTASFGVAALADDITSAEAWIARADVPLYEAKRGGRNRCTVA
ncbi:MAG TPA: diguanylate cyclase [Novosphingobium sp.]|nr:diguanylate cyclase [Novosphingobium sp.]